jgi:hypothetical protein
MIEIATANSLTILSAYFITMAVTIPPTAPVKTMQNVSGLKLETVNFRRNQQIE